MSFFAELKRRKIIQVAAVYLVVAWLIVQIIVAIEAPLHLPDWVDTLVIVLLAVGFPITLIFSWGFNLTPEGIVREGADPSAGGKGLKIEYVLLGVIVAALVWLVYRVEFSAPQTVAASSALTESVAEDVNAEASADVLPNSIAVLPFENLSPDPDNAFFAAGIHESTVSELGKVRDLLVIASTSVMQYAEDPPPIPDIAAALRVEAVLVASVRYANGRVLIAPKLFDGKTGAHLWSKDYDRNLTDVFAVQADVATQIATAMRVLLQPDERARIASKPTESAEAYEHYLRAISLPRGREYTPAMIASLERAIAVDPEFAEAYVRLALLTNVTGNIDAAVEYLNKAIELDPTLGKAYQLLGDIDSDYFARQGNYRDLFNRALELSPNDPSVLSYHCYRLADDSQNYAEAILLCRRAVAIEPTSQWYYRRLGYVLMRAGYLAEAEASLGEAIEIDPVAYQLRVDIATLNYLDGKFKEAAENLDHAVRLMSARENFRVDYIAYLYGLLGDTDMASDLLERFETIYGDAESAAGRTLGFGILGTREKDRALRDWTQTVDGYLEKNLPVSPGRISRFRDNWLNDPMLEEPEFLKLRRRLGYRGQQ